MDSARRVLQVLLMFGEDRPAITAAQIVSETQMSPASVYRYIALLREVGLAEERSYGTYALSPRALALGRAAEVAFSYAPVVRPALQQLTDDCGESALLMRRVDDHAVCTDIVEAPKAVRLSFTLGHVMPLHRGAAPKVLLAGMGQLWVEGYVRRIGPDLPAADRSRLLSDVQRIRKTGWSHSSAEVDEGIWAAAAPVTSGDRIIAAITVAGPRFRIDADQAEHIHRAVVETARRLSQAAGSPSAEP